MIFNLITNPDDENSLLNQLEELHNEVLSINKSMHIEYEKQNQDYKNSIFFHHLTC